MGPSKKILVIEDNTQIADILKKALEESGFEVVVKSTLASTFAELSMGVKYDLMVLDLILPDGDGLDILKYLRNSHKYKDLPVIIISAKGQELDRVLGLELGADDYVVKPFSLREVILRIKRLFKKSAKPPSSVLSVGPFTLDRDKKAIYVDGKLLELTSTEYRLLSLFIEHPHKVFSREEVLDLIWGDEKELFSRVLDAYICRIRTKLGERGKLLQTVRGLGYRLVAD